mmetsp:Transcript_5812/g.12247  ORF Transcript_5812/g.12247 Transcript_5812/m.12247 type:complete len:344 (-) Transcript_5812:55-1086(-)
MWSVGVITYCLLSGYKPFWGPPRSMPWKERRKIMMDRIMRCDYMKMDDKSPTWSKISKPAKDFVASLLQLDPANRPSAQEALDNSAWLKKSCASCATGNTEDDSPILSSDDVVASSQGLVRIQDRARDILVNGLSESELMALQHEIEVQDTMGSGRVDVMVFWSILMNQQSEKKKMVEDLDQLFRENKILVDGDGGKGDGASIEFIDFFARALEEKGRVAMDAIAKACDDLDTTGTRTVSMKELKPFLDQYFPTNVTGDGPGLEQQIHVEDDGMVSTIQVLELVGKHVAKHTRNSIHGGDDSQFGDGDDNLVNASNAEIPGGRKFEQPPKFVYDAGQKSMRKA